MANDYLNTISNLIQNKKVVNMETIKSLLPNRSKISIFRDLEHLGCLTSYNNAGGYYTLPAIPKFDDDDIWIYGAGKFSSHGTLKNTVRIMVENSYDGRTHDELSYKLGVRVQNTLHDLVTKTIITRDKCQGVYVYFHIDIEIRRLQMDRRNGRASLQTDPYITIEILLAVIKHPEHSIAEIQKDTAQKGLNIGINQIEAVFRIYDLGKKNSLLPY